jgi:PAS domain S-box-containing protein
MPSHDAINSSDEGKTRQELLEEIRALRSRLAAMDGMSESKCAHCGKREESALKETELMYRELVRKAPAAIYEIDFRKNRFISVNAYMSTVSGYTREELLSMNPFDLLTGEEKARYRVSVAEYLNGAPLEGKFELKIRTKDGRILDVALDATSTRAEDGRPLGAMGVAREVTRQRREERKTARYNRILRAINQVFEQVIRAESKEVFGETCLATALELTESPVGFFGEIQSDGRLHDLAISRLAWEKCSIQNPFGHRQQGSGCEVRGLYGRVLRERKSFYTNKPSGHPGSEGLPEGHPLLDSFLGVPLRNEGEIIGILAVANRQGGYCRRQVEDLEAFSPAVKEALLRKRAEQALEESEERLRLATEAADIFGWEVDLKTGVYKVSKNAEQVVGLPLPRDLAEVWEAIHPEDVTRAGWIIGRSIAESSEFKVEYRVGSRRPGREIWIFTAGLTLCGYDGKPDRIVGVTQNITHRKRNEMALKELNETLEERVAERTELAETRAKQLRALAVELINTEERERRRVAEILHDDLQQLLAGAKMQLEGACRKTPPPVRALSRVRELLTESITKARHLSHELSPPVLHYTSFLDALEWLIGKMEAHFGLAVHLEAHSDIYISNVPLKVFLFRALHEFLFNTVKHARVQRATICLATSFSGLKITVSDKGRGFDIENIETPSAQSGLGLLSLRERADSMGIGLAMESSPGWGCRITMSVPEDLLDNQTMEPEEPRRGSRTYNTGNHEVSFMKKGTRIVFADDHQVMREALVSMMDNQPEIEVVGEAATGAEAVDMVKRLKPHVVVMDVSMPVMDGMEATRRIKKEFPEVRVIGLSMYNDEQIERVMRQAGAEAFLSKAGSSADLLKAIRGANGRTIEPDG